jgi:hypothetical protein
VGVALANGEEIQAKAIVSSLDPKRTYLKLLEKGALDAVDPDIHRYATNFKIRGSSGKLKSRWTGCRASQGCRRKPPGAPSISAATSTISSAPSTITNTAPGPSGPSSTS